MGVSSFCSQCPLTIDLAQHLQHRPTGLPSPTLGCLQIVIGLDLLEADRGSLVQQRDAVIGHLGRLCGIRSEHESLVAACRRVPFVAQSRVALAHVDGQQAGAAGIGVSKADLRQKLHRPLALAAPRPLESRRRERNSARTGTRGIWCRNAGVGHEHHHVSRVRGVPNEQPEETAVRWPGT